MDSNALVDVMKFIGLRVFIDDVRVDFKHMSLTVEDRNDVPKPPVIIGLELWNGKLLNIKTANYKADFALKPGSAIEVDLEEIRLYCG